MNDRNELESFIVKPRKWWEEKYNVKIDKSSFSVSVKFLDDYFDNIQKKRNEQINIIIDEER